MKSAGAGVGQQPRAAQDRWRPAVDLLGSELLISEPKTFIREVFAALLLLRWAELRDSEHELKAVLEGRPYEPLLPGRFRWRSWAAIEPSEELVARLGELATHLENRRTDRFSPFAWHLPALSTALRRVLESRPVPLCDFVRWTGELPFETSGERRALLDVLDQVVEYTATPYEGHLSTPENVARLIATLADPKPGERLYDPCFGFGDLLLAAWQEAGRRRKDSRSRSAQLGVSGIEINAHAFLIGLTRMMLVGIDRPHVEIGLSLEREAPVAPSHGFDLVLSAPPIGGKVARDTWRHSHFAIRTNDSTSLYIQHALSQLRPNGRAIIVVPESFLFRGGAIRDLRRRLVELGQVEAVIGLPTGTFAPYTQVKTSLLVLRKQGGVSQVRMVDATGLASLRLRGKDAGIRGEVARQLVVDLARRTPRKTGSATTDSAADESPADARAWDAPKAYFAETDWDLSTSRLEDDGLSVLLANLQVPFGGSLPVACLSDVAQVIAGRSVKSVDLLSDPSSEGAIGYIRIKDLKHGKVGRASSWLREEVGAEEQRWTLLPGDVLVSKSGTIGKTGLVRNEAVRALASSGLYVLRAEKEHLDAGFLFAYLSSPACQNWLSSRSRGAVIRHLNREEFADLPVPIPSMLLQLRAAAQFRDFGTDPFTFLAGVTGSGDVNRLSTWLAELSSKLPTVVPGLDDGPPLSLFEPLAAMTPEARLWLEQQVVSTHATYWMLPLVDALAPLGGVTKIPPGPGLLSVLQHAHRGMLTVVECAPGQAPTDVQARTIAERIRKCLQSAIEALNAKTGLSVREVPDALAPGSLAEFMMLIRNDGVLPLRDLHLEAVPDWLGDTISYWPEGESIYFHCRGEVPKKGGQQTIRLRWQGQTLLGDSVDGEIELALRIAKDTPSENPSAELGGSPYVTGSPLEPQPGHDVFFGREELIAQISRQISLHGNVVLLEGNRRTGKTSILKHLEGHTAIPGWLAVYSSLQGAEGAATAIGVPTAEVFREIARSIATALTKLAIDVILPNGKLIAAGMPALGVARACREGISSESPFADFRDYLEQVLSIMQPLGLSLVLMLDEFDKLQEGIDSGVTSPQVPENIRSLIQNLPQFSAILTGSRRLKRLREVYWSALFGLGTSISVASLDTQHARRVVTEPVRDRLIFSEGAIERVITLTARHPYLIQCLCNRVFDYAVQTNTRSITLSIVDDAARHLVRDNEHFASLWDYAGRGPTLGRHRRQLILLLCARGFKHGSHSSYGTLHEQLAQGRVDVDDDGLESDLAYLRELDLIELTGEIGDGQYSLAIPLMADWIAQHQDADVVASRARHESEEENA